MFGCDSRAAARTSRRKRSAAPGRPTSSGLHDLQRDDAVHEQVDGPVHRAHRPGADAAAG